MNDVKVIGVAGGSGSGKTTVVEKIVEVFESSVARLAHDSYYRDEPGKSLEERQAVNYDHPLALETELLVEHVKKLKRGEGVEEPVYDFVGYRRLEEVKRVEARGVVIVEGILLLDNLALRELLDLKVYVDTPADIRFIRRLTRDIKERGRSMESVVGQYLASVRPMHEEFVEPSKKWADIILPEGGLNQRGMELILARIRELIG